jgi:hypothetical protein
MVVICTGNLSRCIFHHNQFHLAIELISINLWRFYEVVKLNWKYCVNNSVVCTGLPECRLSSVNYSFGAESLVQFTDLV